MTDPLKFSIVINTDGRRDSLDQTLNSLRYLDYSAFEVCVVYGPTPDGTAEMLQKWAGRIKVLPCPTRNLSTSRNLGIGLAAGDVVAFIDDDAIPESDWLSRLAEAYSRPETTAAGGFVFDPTGVTYQWRFGTTNRLGHADQSWERATPDFNFPFSANFPHLLGTNSSARRTAAVDIGGFDENFEYYLDETDFLCRLLDNGGHIDQLDGACIHHKFRPSHIRDAAKLVKNWYPIIKNKIYYSLVNNRGHHSYSTIVEDAQSFINRFDNEVKWAMSVGLADENDAIRFREQVERAWRDGLFAGLGQRRILRTRNDFANLQKPFLPFQTQRPSGTRRLFCFLSQAYGTAGVGGIGRYTQQIASTLSDMGHETHVFTRGHEFDTVDFEDGVWVHRVRIDAQPNRPAIDGVMLPEAIWNYSATMLKALNTFAAGKQVDAVFAPIWDCEGYALLQSNLPLVTTLHTSLRFFLESHPDKQSDHAFMRHFATPVLGAEQELFRKSPLIMANSQAIVNSIEAAYGIHFESDRLFIVPHGMEDWRSLTPPPSERDASDTVRLLFVGRLEGRKGIDILLQALDELFAAHANLSVDIVGSDSDVRANDPIGKLVEATRQKWPTQCTFHGEVSEQALRAFYRDCDVFVAPSRFESFGLILVEAMVFAKPVVACRAGGMPEVVSEGESGLLAEPGDVASLVKCITELVSSADLRRNMGLAGRRRFEAKFSNQKMGETLLAQFTREKAARSYEHRTDTESYGL